MKKLNVVVLTAIFFLIFALAGVQCSKIQSTQQPDRVRKITVTGVIAEGYNNYIIQGKSPSTMIWTILNSEPKVLDEYTKTGKTVTMDLWIVSGDNVKILTIDGMNYPKDIK